jgi:hypothetical protein
VLFRSTNGGQSWEAISPDLTRNDKAKQKGGRLEEYYSTIFTIAESRREKGVIWTGSDDGLVQLTRNGGRDWQNVTPPALQPFTRVNIIEASPHDPGTAYSRGEPLSARRLPAVHLQDHRLWQVVAGDRRQGFPNAASSVRFGRIRRVGVCCSPARRPAFTTRSTAGAMGIAPAQSAVVPITDLAIKNGDLIAATQGRAFWVLDDITPLQTMSDAVTTAAAHLFAPREAVRSRRGGFGRGAMGAGQNPPGGATITYSLNAAQMSRSRSSTPAAL